VPSPEALSMIEMFRANVADPNAPQPSLAEQRAGMDAMISSIASMPADASTEDIKIAGRDARWVSVPESETNRVVLYLHGGGYVVGSIASHSELAARIARAGKARVLVLDYRLAPEDPFPAAVEDAVAAYDYLLAQGISAGRIAIAGDSAGGGLTIATLIALRDAGKPVPGAGVAMSPWVDLTHSGETMTTKVADDPMLTLQALEGMASSYAGAASRTDPLVSPLNAELSGLPPMLVQVGTAEVLLSDSERIVEKLRAAGVPVEFQSEEGLFHVFQLFPLYPEAADAIERIGMFLQAELPALS